MGMIHATAQSNPPQKLDGYLNVQTEPEAKTISAWKSVTPFSYNAFISPDSGEAIPQYSATTGWNVYGDEWGDSGITIGPDTTGAISSSQGDLGGSIVSPTDSQAATAYGYGGYNG